MAQPPLKTDSALSRRIVRAFLDFLDSVEPAPGVDTEGLEVAKECLTEAFRLDLSSEDDRMKPDLLVEIFSSLETNRNLEAKSDMSSRENDAYAPSSSGTPKAAKTNISEAPTPLGDDWTTKADASGVAKDELFGKFFAALEEIHFFRTTPDGRDDPDQLEKATRQFHEALAEMGRSGCQELNQNGLAEALKSQGNSAMQSKLYTDAIELYSCAIALRGDNAVYYCNRAAAYTQIQKYNEAIMDCLKSIEIDPNYSKAYSRLGLVYYAQGNYVDAIEKGFKRALQLDPNNDSVRENIRVAEQKLREQERAEHGQGTSSGNDHSTGGSRNHTAPAFFTSMPLPADFANVLRNMATGAHQEQHSENRQAAEDNANVFEEPEIRIERNINLNFGEGTQMPEEVTGALRSVMEIISGGIPHGNQPDTTNGRSPSN